jgi:hypothetical protein
MAKTYKNKTRKVRAANLDVRSDGAVKMFEKTLINGPLTLVFVKLEGCGPCDRLNQDVWSHLTKLKNRSVNLARVDSKVFPNTSLANTPPKYYPTLMVVGKDGKPATFKDKDGNLTHSMPRQNTLSEDKEALSSLVQNPTVKSLPELLRANTTPRTDTSVSHKSPFTSNQRSENNMPSRNNQASTLRNTMSPRNNMTPRNTMTPRNDMTSRNTMAPRNDMTSRNTMTPRNEMSEASRSLQGSKQILSSIPPDIGADLISSNTPNGVKKESTRGGRLLAAIRGKSASMKALLRLSEPRVTRKHRR